MKLIARIVTLLAVATCSAGCAGSNPSETVNQVEFGRPIRFGGVAVPACTGSRIEVAQCDVLVRTDPAPRHGGLPAGLSPSDLQSAYNLPSSSKGSGQIVAIVDAYDNPDAASDLGKYRKTFGLPKGAFKKYNQVGQEKNYPQPSGSWGLEIDLDVEMVSASCPNCTIFLVEANSNGWGDLETAEGTAVALGAHIVSNSYSGGGANESYYDAKGVTYLASSGDDGYGYIYDPADFGSVVAVGGTTLSPARVGNRKWIETAWGGASAACSRQPKPAWQHDPGCPYRTETDASAVADPNTGVAEYDSLGYGWMVSGGTSVSSPLMAGVFGLAGNASMQNGGKTFWERNHQRSTDLFRITSGNDGSCSPRYLCTAGTREYREYSGPAGWGTPNSIGAF